MDRENGFVGPMYMKWIQALKLWNGQRSSWCIPRKGTIEYDEVRTIMSEGGAEGLAPPRTERFDRPAGPRRRRVVPAALPEIEEVEDIDVEIPELPERARGPARRKLPTPGGPRPMPAGAAVAARAAAPAKTVESLKAFLRSAGDDSWKYYPISPGQGYRLYEAVWGKAPSEDAKAVIRMKILNPMATQKEISEATGVSEGWVNKYLGKGVRLTGEQYTTRGPKNRKVIASWMIPLPVDV